ncbi:hypothetical protein Tco_0404243 [Tanacetum coccineum]
MVDSQPMEEKIQGVKARDVGTETHEGSTEPVLQQAKTKATPRRLAYADSDKEALASQRIASKNKEPVHLRRSRRLEDWSITKEKTRRERSKSRGKRFGHEIQIEEGSKDTYEDLNSPYKRPKPTPFTQRITRFKYHQRAKLPRNIRVYKGNKDPEDHLDRISCGLGEVGPSGEGHRWNNQRNGSQGRNNVKIINMIRGGEYRHRPFEGERFGLTNELTFLEIPQNQLRDEHIILEEVIEGHQV